MVLAFSQQEHCFVPVRQDHCFVGKEHFFVQRSMVLSTGAMLCRPEHSDRSMPQEHCGFGGSTVLSQSDRSIVVAVGALFCRQEHGLSA